MSAKVLAGILGTEGKIGRDFVPLIPDLPTIDVQTEQNKAIAGNIAALPQANLLASGVNKFNFDELQKMYQAAVPGYQEMLDTGGKQINSMLKGELPPDVQRTIERSSGAKSFAGGYGGSGMAGAASAESVGLSSLSLIREGLSVSERWLQSAASRLPHLADSTSMFISPAQQISVDAEERKNQFNYQMMRAKYAASPNAMDNAITGLTDWVEGILASAATMGVSGAMGGGGSGGGGIGGMMGGMGAGGGGAPPTGGSSLSTGQFPGESLDGFNGGNTGMF